MRARRGIISWLLAFALVFGLLPVPYLEKETVYAAEPTGPTEGTIEGTQISWKLTVDEAGWDLVGKGDPYTLTLTGTGPMVSWTAGNGFSKSPWISYKDNITTIVVEDGITSIGDWNFIGCSSIMRIRLADSVTSIGESPFTYKSLLKEFHCPAGLKTIGEAAFQGCGQLETLELNEGLEEIGAEAFLSCSKLANVNFPASLTSVDRDAFANAGLISLKIPSTLTDIGEGAFCNMQKLQTIEVDAANPRYQALTGTLYELRDDGTPFAAIAYAIASGNTALNIAAGTENIGYKTYTNAKKLVSVTLPESMRIISDMAFYQCEKLEAMVIPYGVTSIGKEAFYSCKALRNLTLSDSVVTIMQKAFGTTAIEELVIPDSVVTIEKQAFSYCKSLVKVTIGKGLQNFTGEIFSSDEAVVSVTVSEENPYWADVDNVVYSKDYTKLCYYPAGKEDRAYYVLNTTQYIMGYAIYECNLLQALYLPASLTQVASVAIMQNEYLVSIYFEGNAPKISSNSFRLNGRSGTDKIQLLMYRTAVSTGWDVQEDIWTSADVNPNPFQEWDPENTLTEEGSFGDLSWKYLFSDRSMTITGSGEIPDFDETNPVPWSDFVSSIQTVDADGMSGVGNYAFQGAASLARLKTDVDLTRIGDYAFADCGKLLFININTVETIGAGAFQNNSAVKNDLVLAHVTSIGAGAFKGCTKIPNAFLGAHLASIEDELFADCTGLSGFFIPESVSAIGARAFAGCVNLRTINIPAAVRQIGAQSFADSRILEKVYFYGEAPTVWGADSFTGCSDTLNLYYRKAVTGWENLGGVWNGIPVVGLDRFYTENEDHYSFSNSRDSFGYAYDYRIPRQRYVDVLESITTGTYYYAINERWQGSCYGMAASTLGFYENPEEYRLTDYDANAENLYAIAAPRRTDAALTKLIEACQIAQYKACIAGSAGAYSTNIGKYMKLIQRVEEFERSGGLRVDSLAEPIIMLITSSSAGHAVIPLSVEQTANGDFSMQIYDPNYPRALQTLVVNKDFSGIRYGAYTQASFANYSAFAEAMSGVTLYNNEADQSVYLSIDKESGNIKSSDGMVLEEIEGAYEQLPFNGDETDTFSGIKSFVLPEGDYQITAVSPEGEEDSSESNGTETVVPTAETDETGSIDETVTFYMATQNNYAQVTTSDEEAVLKVTGSDVESGTVAIELESPSTETGKTTVTVMNGDGVERVVEVDGANVKVTTGQEDAIIVEVPGSETVTIDGQTVEVIDGQAVGSFLANDTENYLNMGDFVTNVACDSTNKLTGAVYGAVVSSALLPKNVTVTAEYFDADNRSVAVCTKDLQLNLGWNPIVMHFEGLDASFDVTEGEITLSCKLTVTDGTHSVSSVMDGYTVTLESGTQEPDSETPDSEEPGSETPDSEVPDSEEPGSETPDSEEPESETPDSEEPGSETPDSEEPGSETPDSEEPGGETPDSEEPESETLDSEIPDSETPNSEIPDSQVPVTPPTPGTPDTGGTPGNPQPVEKVPVQSIRSMTKTKKVTVGEKLTLKVNVLPANATDKSVTWTSSNKKYATVSAKGVVTAKKAGVGKTVVITATANDGSGVKATHRLQIKPSKVTKIKLTTKKTTVKAGSKLKINATVTIEGKGASKKLKWKTSNKKYATVNAKGVVTTKKAGKGKTIKVTATATDGSKKKATIKINIK